MRACSQFQGAVLHWTCEAMFHECCDLCSPVWVVVPEGSKEISNDGVALYISRIQLLDMR